jgi:DNA-binding NtrC family response regulator
MARVLIVDDEGRMRALLAMGLDSEGYEVDEAESAEGALEKLGAAPVDLVIADIRLGGMSGLELLGQIRARSPDVECIVMTAYADAKSGIEAMRGGAFEYVAKPFEMDHMLLLVKSALEKNRLRREVTTLRAGGGRYDLDRLRGESKAMHDVVEQAKIVAPRDTTVLLRGASGTGKELVARGIHAASGRDPFVPINCAALPETLLESELFGHEKGAFTGASARKPGLFETAGDGTVFLDEIGDIPPSIQVKLLRVLQEKEFTRVGGTEAITTRARVIAATNRDLEGAVRDGAFREDLYYRLNVFPIRVPSLSERRSDIPGLVDTLCLKHRHLAGLAEGVMDRLVAHSWPGNVRELDNCIERAAIMAAGAPIELAYIPETVREPHAVSSQGFVLPPDGVSLDEVEKSLIVQALRAAGGNKTKAAELLGISRRAIYSKMKTHGMVRDDEPE